MIRFGLLILCLLASFRVTSQNDTIRKIVLSENVGREVVKDLVRGDVCAKILKERDKQVVNFKDIITRKDTIISYQKNYIDYQDKTINSFYRFKVNGFVGVETRDVRDAIMYLSVFADYNKIRLGARYYSNYQYSINLEYKLF
jgi:hypothetical protein